MAVGASLDKQVSSLQRSHSAAAHRARYRAYIMLSWAFSMFIMQSSFFFIFMESLADQP
jgi:hypothetical protein